MSKKKLLIIDTFNFLHRAYHALPKTFKDQNGNPTNAIYGVTSMLINIFDSLQPDYAVAAVDGKDEETFRAKAFEQYKAHRKPMDAELAVQIDPVLSIIDSFGIKRIVVEGYEADDVIGTIVTRFSSDPDLDIILASNDRDMWQLIKDNVLILLPNTQDNVQWLGKKEADARLGFDTKYITDYKGLKGDTSDNIPGVKGIGDKTASSLIDVYGTLEEIYAHIAEIKPDSVRKKLIEGRESAFMSKELATIVKDVPFEFELSQGRFTQFNKVDVKRELEKYNFKSLIRRLGFETDSKKKVVEVAENQTSLF